MTKNRVQKKKKLKMRKRERARTEQMFQSTWRYVVSWPSFVFVCPFQEVLGGVTVR